MKHLHSLLVAPLRAFSELKLLGVLLLVNLCLALIQSAPILIPLLSQFGHSLSGQGRPFPSTEAVFDFTRLLAQGGGPFLAGPLLMGLLLSFAMQPVLAGGIVSRLCSPERFTLAEFSRNCGGQLGRNLRLLGWAMLGLLPMAALPVIAGIVMTRAGKHTLFNTEGTHWVLDSPFNGWNVAHLALVVLVLALWRSSFDLARVQLYADDQRKTRVAAWRALKQMARSPGALLGYIVLGVIGLGVVLALARVHAAVSVTSAGKAWLAILVAQFVVIARLGFSVATTAFTVEVYRVMPPLPVKAPAVEAPGVVALAADAPPVTEAPAAPPQPASDETTVTAKSE